MHYNGIWSSLLQCSSAGGWCQSGCQRPRFMSSTQQAVVSTRAGCRYELQPSSTTGCHRAGMWSPIASGSGRLWWVNGSQWTNTLRPRWNEQHFADDIFKRIFFNENVWISIKISLKFVPKGAINKIPALFQIMAWRRPGDKPLSGTMLVSLLTHKCVTRPQWVKAPCRLRHKIEDGFIVCKHSK